MKIAQDCGNRKGGVCGPAQRVELRLYSGVMTSLESGDGENILSAHFKRSLVLFTGGCNLNDKQYRSSYPSAPGQMT
jgi:hypothetical protein